MSITVTQLDKIRKAINSHIDNWETTEDILHDILDIVYEEQK